MKEKLKNKVSKLENLLLDMRHSFSWVANRRSMALKHLKLSFRKDWMNEIQH
jgi:hypothetical protein